MLQPVTIVPSAVSSAAPTLRPEYFARACFRAARAAAISSESLNDPLNQTGEHVTHLPRRLEHVRMIDRLRQDVYRLEQSLVEHRERESALRNTLLTAQRLADEIKESAQTESKLIIREAQGRADLLLQKAQGRLSEIERDIDEMRLRRRDVEGTLESSIQSLYRALEFIRDQDRSDDKVLLHRPRQTDQPQNAAHWQGEPRAAEDRG